MTATALAPLEKEAKLLEQLRRYSSAALAYSGGVDSTYLADVAHEALGENLLLLIAEAATMPREEYDFAVAQAKNRGWRLESFSPAVFDQVSFVRNSDMRCYYCKTEIFAVMAQHAAAHGITVLLHGETAEDAFDTTRVGIRAAREAGVHAPLADQGFTKADIRERSKARELPTWDKASFACLATRIPTGTPLSTELLNRIETAEAVLKDSGFHQYRARHHGNLCRIEIEPEEFPRLLDPALRQQIITAIQSAGYTYVTLDLKGYGRH